MNSSPRLRTLRIPPTGPAGLSDLFPEGVVVEVGSPDDHEAPLLPGEETAVQNAVAKRRREFRAGRAVARRALARLGVADAPLVPGPDRAPQWPDGFVGSITHCLGFVGAAVARVDVVRAIGLDAEPVKGHEPGVVRLVCTPRELDRWREYRGRDWESLVFSAKEAVFKCLNPLTGVWLDFQDVALEFEANARFRVDWCTHRALADVVKLLSGRYLWEDGRWVTGAVVR